MDNKVYLRYTLYIQSGGVLSEDVYGEILMKNASSHRIRRLLGAVGETRRAEFEPYRKLNLVEVSMSNPLHGWGKRLARVSLHEM